MIFHIRMLKSILTRSLLTENPDPLRLQLRYLRGKKSANVGVDRLMKSLDIENRDVQGKDMSELDFENEDYDHLLSNPDEMVANYQKDLKIENRKVRKHIIKNEFFKPEKQTNLLTWAAKQQIRYLNNLDQDEWTPERLSESFPIDAEGIKKLLKNKMVLTSKARINKHDEAVKQNWKLLKSGKPDDSISLQTRLLWAKKLIKEDGFNGCNLIPKPPSDVETTNNDLKKVKLPIGEFSKFLDIKQEIECLPENNKRNMPSEDDMVAGSTYMRFNLTKEDKKPMTAKIFEENVKKAPAKSLRDYEYKSWIEKVKVAQKTKVDSLKNNEIEMDDRPEKIKKYVKDEFIEFNIDHRRGNSRIEDAYYYDEEHGYQDHLGFEEMCDIVIPKNYRNSANLFKVKNSYYDQNGTFLYRVPQKK